MCHFSATVKYFWILSKVSGFCSKLSNIFKPMVTRHFGRKGGTTRWRLFSFISKASNNHVKIPIKYPSLPFLMPGTWPAWCPEYDQEKLVVFRTSHNDIRNRASFSRPYSGHPFCNDVRNSVSDVPGHVPNITNWCPECDQRSWSNSGQCILMFRNQYKGTRVNKFYYEIKKL